MTSSLEPNKGRNFYGTSQVEAFEMTIGAASEASEKGSSNAPRMNLAGYSEQGMNEWNLPAARRATL
jgi:hypothetical protein